MPEMCLKCQDISHHFSTNMIEQREILRGFFINGDVETLQSYIDWLALRDDSLSLINEIIQFAQDGWTKMNSLIQMTQPQRPTQQTTRGFN